MRGQLTRPKPMHTSELRARPYLPPTRDARRDALPVGIWFAAAANCWGTPGAQDFTVLDPDP
jgi:hypothetical protein